MRFLIQESPQLWSVDQISVMRQAYPIWAIHIKGLCLRVCAATSGGISKMSQSHEAWEIGDAGSVMENLRSHSIPFALKEPTSRPACRNTACILSTVLQQE